MTYNATPASFISVFGMFSFPHRLPQTMSTWIFFASWYCRATDTIFWEDDGTFRFFNVFTIVCGYAGAGCTLVPPYHVWSFPRKHTFYIVICKQFGRTHLHGYIHMGTICKMTFSWDKIPSLGKILFWSLKSPGLLDFLKRIYWIWLPEVWIRM